MELRIEEYRKAKGWSQSELARRAAMHSSTISLIEGGRFVPGESQLEKLAEALGVTISELEDVTGDEQ